MAFTARSVRSAAGTCATATLVLVLAFGNPAYVEWAHQNASTGTAGGLFLRTLSWPAWHITPANGSGSALRDLLAADLTAILLIVAVAVLVGAAVGASRAGFGTFLLGWGCAVVAAGVAGFVAAFLAHDASVHTSMLAGVSGAGYGLLVCWLIGLAGLSARR